MRRDLVSSCDGLVARVFMFMAHQTFRLAASRFRSIGHASYGCRDHCEILFLLSACACGNACSFLSRSGLLHELAVEMPIRMCENRQHECEANERKQETDHQRYGDDQSPKGYRERVREHRSNRCANSYCGTYVAIEKQGK